MSMDVDVEVLEFFVVKSIKLNSIFILFKILKDLSMFFQNIAWFNKVLSYHLQDKLLL